MKAIQTKPFGVAVQWGDSKVWVDQVRALDPSTAVARAVVRFTRQYPNVYEQQVTRVLVEQVKEKVIDVTSS